ncbi:MAG TPA: hypothetical protein VFF09_00210 [archaeon]|nr:hypothetical protein [archaeon]
MPENHDGQSALEYLLILGAGLIIVVVAILLLTGLANVQQYETTSAEATALCNHKASVSAASGGPVNCTAFNVTVNTKFFYCVPAPGATDVAPNCIASEQQGTPGGSGS